MTRMVGSMLSAILGLFALPALAAGDAVPRFAISEVEPAAGEIAEYWFADLDGDGASDLALTLFHGGRGREIEIYLQRPDGKFPATPDRRIEVKQDIVACACADLRAEPGEEILFFTRSAAFSFSSAKQGYAGNAEKALDWEFICELPDRKRLPRIWGQGPAAELLLPAPDGYALVAVERSGEKPRLLERARFAVTPEASADLEFGEREVKVTLSAGFDASSALLRRRADLILDPVPAATAGSFTPSTEAPLDLIDSEHWLPAPALADADGDGDLDWFLLDRFLFDTGGAGGKPALRIQLRRADGGFGTIPDWTAEFAPEGSVRLDDLDGDGKADLWVIDENDKDGARLRAFKNRGVRFDLDAPDQVLKVSGRAVEARVLDLDGDRRMELVVSSFDLPMATVVTDVSITRTLLVYRGEGEALFGRRPASRLEEQLRPSEWKGLAHRIQPGVAIGGASARAALIVERDGTIGARRFDAGLALEPESFWKFTPRRTVIELRPHELNGDGSADLVLRHIGSLTLLVSKP